MRKLLATTVCSLGLAALAVPAAFAQADDPAAARPQSHRQARHHEKRPFSLPSERVEARIAYLKTALEITDAQAPQWNAYAEFLRSQAREKDQRIKSWHERAQRERGPRRREFTAIERIEFAQQHLADALHRLNEQLAVEKPLYEALSPEQKRVADEVLAHGHGRRGFRHEGPRRFS